MRTIPHVATAPGTVARVVARRRPERRATNLLAVGALIACLLASCSSGSSGSAGKAAGRSSATRGPQTVLAVIGEDPHLLTYLTALRLAAPAGTLQGKGPFTVFAPTNDAFKAPDAAKLASAAGSDSKKALGAMATYAIVPGALRKSQLKAGRLITLNGAPLTVSTKGGQVTLTDVHGDTVTLTSGEKVATNGVVYTINSVLLPTPP